MHNLRLYPYNLGSQSSKHLSEVLDCLRVRPDGDYVPKIGQVVVNWGNGRNPGWANRASARSVRVLNRPDSVSIAGNKLSTLQALSRNGIAVPEFTTDTLSAIRWLNNGDTIVERHNLRGNSGDGIRIVNLDDPDMPSVITPAPLYTKFIPKTAEFRIHVFRGEVIDYIEKKKVAAERRPANFNKYVSSINLGWIFTRTNVRDERSVRDIAIKAVSTLGLDFGAVDIVYYEGRPYVLEVNTAPGLAGTTLVKYANALRRYMGVSDLSQDVVTRIMTQANESTTAEVAAQVASVNRPVSTPPVTARPVLNNVPDEVILRLDRSTALKLKALLASI